MGDILAAAVQRRIQISECRYADRVQGCSIGSINKIGRFGEGGLLGEDRGAR